MASKVSIANQALTWVGSNTIVSFTEDSTEAGVISANYDGVRDAVLEDCAWSFATKRVTLSPISTPPDSGYTTQFTVPADCLRVLEVRDDGRPHGVNSLDWSMEDNRIASDAAIVQVRYIARVDDPLKYSPNFVQCLAARLAADIAIPLAESRSLQSDLWGLYQKKLADAKTLDGMQGRARRTGSGRFVSVRRGGYRGAAGSTV